MSFPPCFSCKSVLLYHRIQMNFLEDTIPHFWSNPSEIQMWLNLNLGQFFYFIIFAIIRLFSVFTTHNTLITGTFLPKANGSMEKYIKFVHQEMIVSSKNFQFFLNIPSKIKGSIDVLKNSIIQDIFNSVTVEKDFRISHLSSGSKPKWLLVSCKTEGTFNWGYYQMMIFQLRSLSGIICEKNLSFKKSPTFFNPLSALVAAWSSGWNFRFNISFSFVGGLLISVAFSLVASVVFVNRSKKFSIKVEVLFS